MVRELARKLGSLGVRVIYPPTCGGCGLVETWMCEECSKSLKRINLARCCSRCGLPGVDSAHCPRCSVGWPTRLTVRSAFQFDGPTRRTIHLIKYLGEYARAEWAGGEMAAALTTLEWQPDLVAEVPLWPGRQRHRGFNQSEKLATVICKQLSMPHEPALLRARDTRTQVGLDPSMRWTNVKDAFEVGDIDLAGKTVLLIDDVATTGATLAACAAACKQAGASKVLGLTLATVVDDALVRRHDQPEETSTAVQATPMRQESTQSPSE